MIFLQNNSISYQLFSDCFWCQRTTEFFRRNLTLKRNLQCKNILCQRPVNTSVTWNPFALNVLSLHFNFTYCTFALWIQNPVKHLRWRFLSNYFCQKAILRCLTGLWIRLSMLPTILEDFRIKQNIEDEAFCEIVNGFSR